MKLIADLSPPSNLSNSNTYLSDYRAELMATSSLLLGFVYLPDIIVAHYPMIPALSPKLDIGNQIIRADLGERSPT